MVSVIRDKNYTHTNLNTQHSFVTPRYLVGEVGGGGGGGGYAILQGGRLGILLERADGQTYKGEGVRYILGFGECYQK